MKLLKNPLSVRGDSLYCPLSFQLDSYWNCLISCSHCFLRKMNQVWGPELRPMDIDAFKKKMYNGLKNKTPSTSLAYALVHKKTLRWGNKADPFQPIELEHQIAPHVFETLIDLEWSFVIQTKNTEILMNYKEYLIRAHKKGLVTIMPLISPGFEKDWELFEGGRSTHPLDRLRHLKYLNMKYGIPVGVNGEPFIPGYHTIEDFENTIRMLKKYKVMSYNTYNLHLNDYVAKSLAEFDDIDLMRVWETNQDKNWAPIQRELICIAQQYDVVLGCPDFVNSGPDYYQDCNTCCGINVPNPTTFNAHEWKRRLQKGQDPDKILSKTWDGIGDYTLGRQIMFGSTKEMYTMVDAGMIDKEKTGLLF